MIYKGIFKQICKEPYRIFFPLGIFAGFIGVGHWPMYAFGFSTGYSQFFHSSLQSQVYLLCFVAGFLMTAMPKFTSAKHASAAEVLGVLILILLDAVALCFGKWLIAQACFCVVLLSLLLFAKKRLWPLSAKSTMPPLEFVWVPIAILQGLAGTVLMMLVELKYLPAVWFPPAKLMSEQGFILSIVIGVGGFLAPRLMGTFRTLSKPGQLPQDPSLLKIRRYVLWGHLLAGLIFCLSFWLGGCGHLRLSYGLRALIITAEFFWSCSYLRPPRTPDFFAKLLWLSLWFVVLGSWAGFLLPQYLTAMMHIVFIGGFSLMIIAVATMVILSHGGESDQLRRPLAILVWMSVGILGSLAFRVAAVFNAERYFVGLEISGVLWCLTAMSWFFYILPKTFKVMPDEELERRHEEFKQRAVHYRNQ